MPRCILCDGREFTGGRYTRYPWIPQNPAEDRVVCESCVDATVRGRAAQAIEALQGAAEPAAGQAPHLPQLLHDERLDVFCDRCVAAGMSLSEALRWLSEAEREGLVNPYWIGSELWVCRTIRAQILATITRRGEWTHFEAVACPGPRDHLGHVYSLDKDDEWPPWRWTFWWHGHAVVAAGSARTQDEAQADLEAAGRLMIARFSTSPVNPECAGPEGPQETP